MKRKIVLWKIRGRPFILDVVLKLGTELLEQLVPTIYKGIERDSHFLAAFTFRFSLHNKLTNKTTFRVQLIKLCIESVKKFCIL